MNLLVTGGAGYIGSHTVRMLAEAGHEVTVFDNLVKGHRGAVAEGCPLVEGDLLDREAIGSVLCPGGKAPDRPFDAVIHFAAWSYVGESVAEPGKYYRNNIAGGLNLLDAMLAGGCRNIVFSSTAAVYGEPEEMPIRETCPQRPINPYGHSKLTFEGIMEAYGGAHGLKFVSLRYFNAAGAAPDGAIGEDHDPETHLIPLIIMAAMGKRDSVTVFGGDYPTPDGTCVRDYIHIVDLAKAHVLALEWLANGNASRIFNLGNGHGYSVRQVIDSVRRVAGREFTVKNGPRRPGDPATLVASSDLIRETLGWIPDFPELDDIVCHAWKWHSTHPEGFDSRP